MIDRFLRARRGVQGWDERWARRWHNVILPPSVARPLLALVRLGDGWIWIPAAGLLALVLPPGRFLAIAGQGALTAVLSLPLYWALKAVFRRPRPAALFQRLVPRVAPRDTYSFPSGHTMNNLAIAASLAFHLPPLWPIALALPVAIGLLRVLFGVHFLSDIAAGTACGLLVGWGAFALHSALSG